MFYRFDLVKEGPKEHHLRQKILVIKYFKNLVEYI